MLTGGALDKLQNSVNDAVHIIEPVMSAIAIDKHDIRLAALAPDSMGVREGHDGVLPAMSQQNRAGRLHHRVDGCNVVKAGADDAFQCAVDRPGEGPVGDAARRKPAAHELLGVRESRNAHRPSQIMTA